MSSFDTAVMDIDGTLVDSSYQHIAAWHRAFAGVGLEVEMWSLHRAMGMGGDKLVPAVAGEVVEERMGDEIRDLWRTAYDDLLDEVRPLDGATELLKALEHRGLTVVLATSGHPSHTSRTLGILGLSEHAYAFTTSGDASQTKPSPEIIRVALQKVSGVDGLVVGDTVWDVEAAGREHLPAVGLLTGGFSECALRDAGATHVAATPRALLDDLDEVLERSAPRYPRPQETSS